MNKTKIIFRADGNEEIGLGHIYRSLALLDILAKDFYPVFATSSNDDIKTIIYQYCQEIISLPDNQDHLKYFLDQLSGSEIVVLDNYFFTSKYQQLIKQIGCRLVCIDDLHNIHFYADLVINHTGGILEKDYSKEKYTKVFMGPKYALLRKEFLNNSERNKKANKNVFICYGGSDANNDTLSSLKKIKRFDTIENIHVLIGASYGFQNELELFIENNDLMKKVKVYKNINSKEVKRIMDDCVIGVCSASTISYECMSSGMLLFIEKVAENQEANFNFLIREKLAISLEELSENSIFNDLLEEYITNQKRYFDGKQDERLLKIFKEINVKS